MFVKPPLEKVDTATLRRINLTLFQGNDICTSTYICTYTGLALVKRHRFSRWNSLCRAYYGFYVAQSICSWRDKDDRDVSKHTVTCCCRDARFSLSSLNGTIHSCPRAMFKLFRALISKGNMTKDKYYDSSAM